jgi:hypothetical protein
MENSVNIGAKENYVVVERAHTFYCLSTNSKSTLCLLSVLLLYVYGSRTVCFDLHNLYNVVDCGTVEM